MFACWFADMENVINLRACSFFFISFSLLYLFADIEIGHEILNMSSKILSTSVAICAQSVC